MRVGNSALYQMGNVVVSAAAKRTHIKKPIVKAARSGKRVQGSAHPACGKNRSNIAELRHAAAYLIQASLQIEVIGTRYTST